MKELKKKEKKIDNISNGNSYDNLLNNETADIIMDLYLNGESIKIYQIGKNGEKEDIKKNPLIKETNIYNELFNNQKKRYIMDSFNIF